MYSHEAAVRNKRSIEEYEVLRWIFARSGEDSESREPGQIDLDFGALFVSRQRVFQIIANQADIISIGRQHTFGGDTHHVKADLEAIETLNRRALEMRRSFALEIFGNAEMAESEYLEMRMIELTEEHRILAAVYSCARTDRAEIFYYANPAHSIILYEKAYIGLDRIEEVARANPKLVETDGNIYAIKPFSTDALRERLENMRAQLQAIAEEMCDYLNPGATDEYYYVGSGLEAARTALDQAKQTENPDDKRAALKIATDEFQAAFVRLDAYSYIRSNWVEQPSEGFMSRRGKTLLFDNTKLTEERRAFGEELLGEELKLDPKREELWVLGRILQWGKIHANSQNAHRGNTISILDRNLDLLVRSDDEYELPKANRAALIERYEQLRVAYVGSLPPVEEKEARQIPDNLRHVRNYIKWALAAGAPETQKEYLKTAGTYFRGLREDVIGEEAPEAVRSEPVYVIFKRVKEEYRAAHQEIVGEEVAVSPAAKIAAAGPQRRADRAPG